MFRRSLLVRFPKKLLGQRPFVSLSKEQIEAAEIAGAVACGAAGGTFGAYSVFRGFDNRNMQRQRRGGPPLEFTLLDAGELFLMTNLGVFACAGLAYCLGYILVVGSVITLPMIGVGYYFSRWKVERTTEEGEGDTVTYTLEIGPMDKEKDKPTN